MSADKLRQAAKVLRERAESATPGPWEAYRRNHPLYGPIFGLHNIDPVADLIDGDVVESQDVAAGDVDYIATMHPGVGLALADWLDTVGADEWAHGPSCLIPCDECDDDPYAPHARRALAVADLILGGA